ncbi:MAG: hypothetical protein EBT81_10375 [Gammaproteobacteria bacterium]|nr:hypothetical protein [Gammaproteobacteria bacterium]
MKFIQHKRSKEVEKWLRQEETEQKRRYRKIVAEQDALTPKRDKWIADFLYRIQTRGVHEGRVLSEVPGVKHHG